PARRRPGCRPRPSGRGGPGGGRCAPAAARPPQAHALPDHDPAEDVPAPLRALRAADPPTHGGRVLSYVYDSGRADLDRVAAEAAELFLPVNGLDPTTFTSVGVLERDLVAFGGSVLHGGSDVVGSVTSGGTESCLLAVKSARDRARATSGDARLALVLPTSAHPAFRKAAA